MLIALGVADRLRAQRLALSEAERRAQTDALTGVLNRRSLIERLDAACLRAKARGLPIALLFIDLDHFKQINDSYGHQAGDACLRAVVDPIHAELRQSDVIGRYGGEEFVVILSSADAAAAVPIAQRILERVAGVRVDGFGRPNSHDLQHRHRCHRYPGSLGGAPHRPRRCSRLCCKAIGTESSANGCTAGRMIDFFWPREAAKYNFTLTAACHKMILGGIKWRATRRAVGCPAAYQEAPQEDVRGAPQCYQSCATHARVE